MTTPVPPGGVVEMPSKNDWAVTPLTKSKAEYPLDANWADGALHHKISKERLCSIAEQISLLYQSEEKAVRTSVQAFWALCWELAGEQVVRAVIDARPKTSPYRLLWNIPLNLSLGPLSCANDPGAGFDADTEPDPENPGQRRVDDVSAALLRLQKYWDDASAADEGRGVYNAALWQNLVKQLKLAKTAADRLKCRRLLYPPKAEQWLFDTATRQHLRKGLTTFPGVQAGARAFRAARLNAPVIAGFANDANVAATGQASALFRGKQVKLVLSLANKDVHHICVRHTLTFFEFTGKERCINTFWPADRTATFADVTSLVAGLMDGIAVVTLRELTRAVNSEPHEWDGGVVEIGNEDAGGATVYFKTKVVEVVEEDDQWVVDCTAQTVAPNGVSGPGFMRSELIAIAAELG